MIVFRVDSSIQIGSGHLMRCLTLADNLNCETKTLFIARDLDGNLNNMISRRFKLSVLPKKNHNNLNGYEKWLTVSQEQDAQETIEIIKNLKIDLLIVDSYAIDEKWENLIRPYVKRIMVIDDLANRKHDCDILLDQNFYCNASNRYKKIVSENCQLLLGPKYVLLRDEFYEKKTKSISPKAASAAIAAGATAAASAAQKKVEEEKLVAAIAASIAASEADEEIMAALAAVIIHKRQMEPMQLPHHFFEN